ncbi:hypothetical protein GP486_002962 [Trichoglossum hirsutum]|uniref:GTP-binding protein TrmE N-terminal domain-containing protein n=1 Tax=Trichoglossum hirsutum TaxID=265104 RepID=A0A9P8LDT6_9PEZI|nr:hypothetical protein GP486_002962 [Trichoglossum hirsutum]
MLLKKEAGQKVATDFCFLGRCVSLNRVLRNTLHLTLFESKTLGAQQQSSNVPFQCFSMRALPYGVARFLLRGFREGRAAGIPRRAASIVPAGLGGASRVVCTSVRRDPVSISNTKADISEAGRFAAAGGQDTIYALSTTAGRAAVAVIRVSGPACIEVNEINSTPKAETKIKSRYIALYVLTVLSQNHDMQPCVLSMTHYFRQQVTLFSTRAL